MFGREDNTVTTLIMKYEYGMECYLSPRGYGQLVYAQYDKSDEITTLHHSSVLFKDIS